METALDERVGRLEANVEHMQTDVADMKVDIRRLDDRIDRLYEKNCQPRSTSERLGFHVGDQHGKAICEYREVNRCSTHRPDLRASPVASSLANARRCETWRELVPCGSGW